MYDPDNGWRPWPEPSRTTGAGWPATGPPSVDRVARIDAVAQAALADSEDGRRRAGRRRQARPSPAAGAIAGPPAVAMRYLTIYRTLADPAYLDLSIDPDERPLGSLFAFPDPLDANYGHGGLARTMTARGWLSTWSGLSSARPSWPTPCPHVRVPTLLVHPTADTEIRVRQANEIVANAGADDVTYVEHEGRAALPRGPPPPGPGPRRRVDGRPLPVIRRPPPLRFGWLLLASLRQCVGRRCMALGSARPDAPGVRRRRPPPLRFGWLLLASLRQCVGRRCMALGSARPDAPGVRRRRPPPLRFGWLLLASLRQCLGRRCMALGSARPDAPVAGHAGGGTAKASIIARTSPSG